MYTHIYTMLIKHAYKKNQKKMLCCHAKNIMHVFNPAGENWCGRTTSKALETLDRIAFARTLSSVAAPANV